LSVARSGIVQILTSCATVGTTAVNTTGAALRAGATSSGACIPASPVAEFAIFGARLYVARQGFAQCRACLAAVLGLNADSTLTIFVATAARSGARGPFVEVRDLAITRTSLTAAQTTLFQERTYVPAVLCMGQDGAASALRACAAGQGAFTPLTERRDVAVHRTGAVVAALSFGQLLAVLTTVRRFGRDCASTGLEPSAAGVRAVTPQLPVRKFAVYRAGLSIAGVDVGEGATLSTAESSVHVDAPGASL